MPGIEGGEVKTQVPHGLKCESIIPPAIAFRGFKTSLWKIPFAGRGIKSNTIIFTGLGGKLQLFGTVITQKRKDKDKIYPLHKPFTACIAKGKASGPYEFGNKVGLLIHGTQKIVLAAGSFEGNPHDGKTIGPLLEQQQQTGQKLPKEVIYDRGGRAKKTIKKVKITTPSKSKKTTSPTKKRRLRRRFRRRAGIEGIMRHLKDAHRMAQNDLQGEDSPQISAMLSAAGWNMTKWMERVTRVGEAFCWLLEKWADFWFFKPLEWTSLGATKYRLAHMIPGIAVRPRIILSYWIIILLLSKPVIFLMTRKKNKIIYINMIIF